MHSGGWLNTVLAWLGSWLLARAGVRLQLRPQRRDRRGRFRAAKEPSAGSLHLEDIGITERMLGQATPLELPESLDDLETVQRAIRHWIYRNLDLWVNGKGRSVGPVLGALMNTWALDRMELVQRKLQVATVPRRSEVRGSKWIAYPAVRPRSEPFQGVAGALQAAALSHGARAACPPAGVSDTAHCEQGGGSTVGAELASARSVTQGNDVLNHRGTEPQSEDPDLSVPLGLCGESPSLDTSTIAGGRKVLPYAGAAACAQVGEPSTIELPRYDPAYDVAAGLPKAVWQARCEAGYLMGYGNTPQQAVDSYYGRNEQDLRGQWLEFGVPCKVYESYDSRERTYCIARATGIDRAADPQWQARYGAINTTEGLSPGARASSPLAAVNAADAFEQAGGSPTVAPSTTAGGHEVLPYAATSGMHLGNSAAQVEERAECPRPVVAGLQPSAARPPPHYLNLLDPP